MSFGADFYVFINGRIPKINRYQCSQRSDYTIFKDFFSDFNTDGSMLWEPFA